jgi:CheY-like chemotaxis protein
MSLKIMVVDNEKLSLQVMRSLAVPLGHTVLTHEESREALQQAEKQRFDVVFLGMPRPDGLELANRMGSPRPSSETTVVMLSATDDIEMLRKAFGAGASFVLRKPIAASQIVPMLNAMQTPDWKTRRHASRLPLITQVQCTQGDLNFLMRSINISESGMLLESSHDVELGVDVSVQFEITEVGASLDLRARPVRKQESSRVAIEFIELAPENQNSIQLYVMGRLNPRTSPRVSVDLRTNLRSL